MRIQVHVIVTTAEWRRLTGQPDVSPLIEQLARLSDKFLGAVLDEMADSGAAVGALGSDERG